MKPEIESEVKAYLAMWSKDGQYSDEAKRVAEFLEIWRGLRNLLHLKMERVDWTRHFVEIRMPQESLATYDADGLTQLVILAHDLAIRVDVSARGNALAIMFHPRQRGGTLAMRHPSIEDVVASRTR